MKKLVLFVLSLFTVAATAATDPKVAYEQVLKDRAVIIDVREQDEIQSGMIKGALWFPLSKMQNSKNWKKDFEELSGQKTIYLHCRSGKRSEVAKNILKKNDISSENIGGYEELKKILPVAKPSTATK
jgi:phage shock protein E